MPFFDFKCNECNKLSEILVRLSDTENQVCDHCGSSNLEKQVCTPNVNTAGCPGANMKFNRNQSGYARDMAKEHGWNPRK